MRSAVTPVPTPCRKCGWRPSRRTHLGKCGAKRWKIARSMRSVRRVWSRALLAQQKGPIWISVDSTSIARAEAHTSSDRGMIYVPNLPHAVKSVSVGWQFSMLMLLPELPSRWGAVLSQRRISTTETAVSVAISQLASVRPDLPASATLLADRW